MNANDLENEAGYFDPRQDEFEQRQLSDTRKPALSLFALNKLKKMRAARQLENLMRGDVLEIIYGAPAEGGPGGL
jgi:hypothetical protein